MQLVPNTPIPPQSDKKTFSSLGYSLLKVRSMKLLSLFLHIFSLCS
ncbi:hypothetical protein HMPREF9075_00802 [Capnocytophaga sp. oral taxon 332 str. F0381]|nr:hypothetical protein HMPREF9075_00802 [Capnocytophaga sp. oral taxon 332 str. F0381]